MKFTKNLLIIIILLCTDLNTYTISIEPIKAALESLLNSTSLDAEISSINTFDPTAYNCIAETVTEKIELVTVTNENNITLVTDYYNKETGETIHATKQIYPDCLVENQNQIQSDIPLSSDAMGILCSSNELNIISQEPDILKSLSSDNSNIFYPSNESIITPQESDILKPLSSDNSDISCEPNASNNTSQQSDILNDHLNDSAHDARRQSMDENHATQTHNTIKEQRKIIREQDLQKNRVYFPWDFGGIPLDSDIILQKQIVFHDPRSTLSSPIIAARMDRLITFYTYKTNLNSKFQSELAFCKAFKSGKVLDLFNKIYDPHLPTAQAAFNELKELWIRKRKHMFLVNNSYNKKELNFITKLDIDIMIKAERALVTRPDYIAQHADTQSLKIIQEYKEYCTQLQQKGNQSALLDEVRRLRSIAKKRSDFATKISFAIAQKTYFDPTTIALHEIAHTPSLEKACTYVKNLELNLLTQAQQRNILSQSQMKSWIIEQYGFDLLEAAHNCYKSRADYVYTPESQSYLSDATQPILHNIESKNLPQAHAELVHLEKQIDKALAESNITDPIEQKEYIKKSLGRDVLSLAHKTYESRLDHKKLVESFMAIDVNKATASILENNNSYESVANEMSDLAKHIFANAYHCNLSNLPKIESHVNDSIEAMRIAQDHPTFIFNLSMVNHTLGDIQQIAHAILSGTHPVLQRSSELLIEGFSAFLKGLNPITQVSNMGHLAYDLGSLLEKGGSALWNDPIAVLNKGITTTFTLVDLIRNTADFTSDLTVGRLYLSAEEYKQRTDAFCAMIEPLKGVTAEQYFHLAGQLAADIWFFKGLGTAYNFLKEIDALEKLGESTAIVARTFKKGFDTHLADNPVVITTEGIVLKMSNGMKDFNKGPREIINNSKALLESVYAPIADALKTEIELLKKIELPYGFAKFSHKPIRIAYKHILGMEIDLTKKGKIALGGFHHDFQNTIERSKVIDFVNKAINEYGYYNAQLFENGNYIKDASFFPAHWSRRQVADKICEAYSNFIKGGANIMKESGGKYHIVGLTNEGIEIKMYITKAGEITSAYPIL